MSSWPSRQVPAPEAAEEDVFDIIPDNAPVKFESDGFDAIPSSAPVKFDSGEHADIPSECSLEYNAGSNATHALAGRKFGLASHIIRYINYYIAANICAEETKHIIKISCNVFEQFI